MNICHLPKSRQLRPVRSTCIVSTLADGKCSKRPSSLVGQGLPALFEKHLQHVMQQHFCSKQYRVLRWATDGQHNLGICTATRAIIKHLRDANSFETQVGSDLHVKLDISARCPTSRVAVQMSLSGEATDQDAVSNPDQINACDCDFCQ